MGEESLSNISKIVDIPFIQKVLRDSEKDLSIRVLDVFIRRLTNKNDMFASEMYRVSVKYNCQEENEKLHNEKTTLIVKVEIPNEGMHRHLVSNSGLFSTEISMMSDTLAQMNEWFGSDYPPLNGRCLYTQRINPPLLIIEDLAPLGFRMADHQTGLDMDHRLLAIRNLARFHASSVALFERDPDQKSRYIRGMFDKSQPQKFRDHFVNQIREFAQAIANWAELDPKVSEKVFRFADMINEKGYDATVCRKNEFNVLNHGNFSVNNMLFKYDELNRPIEHTFINFQLCLYSSPAVDLIFFFNTSLSEDTLILHEETLVHEYVLMLSSTMETLNCTTEPPSLERVKDTMRERAVYGMIATVMLLPLLVVEKGEVNELSAKEEEMCDGKLYRDSVIRRLTKFDEMGLLDR